MRVNITSTAPTAFLRHAERVGGDAEHAGATARSRRSEIRGVTRDVTLDVDYAGQTKDPWGNVRAGFTAKISIDRKDFGLTWNQLLEAGGVMVGDRIDIEIEVEAVKRTATKAASTGISTSNGATNLRRKS
jgi:hypothetical protein